MAEVVCALGVPHTLACPAQARREGPDGPIERLFRAVREQLEAVQTLHGKTVYGVGELAHARNVPVIAFGGVIDPTIVERLEQRGISVVRIAPDGMPAEESIRNAAKLLEASSKAVALRMLP